VCDIFFGIKREENFSSSSIDELKIRKKERKIVKNISPLLKTSSTAASENSSSVFRFVARSHRNGSFQSLSRENGEKISAREVRKKSRRKLVWSVVVRLEDILCVFKIRESDE
jgi:hypothetical protein